MGIIVSMNTCMQIIKKTVCTVHESNRRIGTTVIRHFLQRITFSGLTPVKRGSLRALVHGKALRSFPSKQLHEIPIKIQENTYLS